MTFKHSQHERMLYGCIVKFRDFNFWNILKNTENFVSTPESFNQIKQILN